jgi:hypothetical protein
MFMMGLGTIWMRNGLMASWLALLTYLTALLLIIEVVFYPLTTLFYQAWDLLINVYI